MILLPVLSSISFRCPPALNTCWPRERTALCSVPVVTPSGKPSFRTSGNTILGADDKAAVAEILEAVHWLDEHEMPHGDLQVILGNGNNTLTLDGAGGAVVGGIFRYTSGNGDNNLTVSVNAGMTRTLMGTASQSCMIRFNCWREACAVEMST